MQAKRKLTALLLSLCMLLGMLPMTAFAAGVPAAPTNLKLEWTETGLKASWDKPETTGGLDIFEYEVTLYGHFDGTAGEKTKVETKTVQRETTCTFTNTGNAEGVINPTYEVEVRAREGVSGTGDPDNLSGYYVTEWTGWSSSSSASYKAYDISVITSVNKYYTGVVDVGLPGSENKLHQEGITATRNPDVTQPDGTTSENEKQAVTELLYQYFEEHKETVPELANVTRDNLMVKTVLERIESSRTVGSINTDTEGRPVVVVHEVVDKCYTLYLEFNPKTDDRPSRPSHSSGGSTGGIGSRCRWRTRDGTPSVTGFESDTNADLTVDGRYQFRITSLDGHTPVLTVNNSNFTVTLASQNGRDYFYVITCAGTPGSTAAVSVDGKYLLTATVGGSASGVVSDTTHPFTVAQGGTYQFRLTAAARPSFAAGSASFTVEYAGQEGNDYFYKVHAVGQAGDGCGFYINGEAQPVAVATIA